MTDPQLLVQERLARNTWGILGSQGYVLGLDLGSYGLRAALVDLHRHSYTSAHVESETQPPDQMVDSLVELARSLMADQGVTADRLVRVGVGIPGPVDIRSGTVRLIPRMSGWENYPLQEKIESAFDAVTLVDNDANLIALGEATFGAGKGSRDLFYLHLSSGVGGGIVLDGRLYHGATSTAGEIGHAVVGHGWSGVGRPATLEELVSIRGLLRRAEELGFATNNLHDLFSDHAVGQQVVREAVTMLAMKLAQVVSLIDPNTVVLGGVVARIGGEPFVQAIAAQVNQFIAPAFARPVQIVPATLGFDSVAIGGIALALESMRD
ncbi:MAG: ROK family protein [Chloroflexaceae bacterium]|jgi:glucokinase|nr:ROK family protein [Chloroflexaceae bacterium]